MFEPKIDLTIQDFDAAAKTQIIHISGQLDKLGLEKVRGDLEKAVHETPAETLVFDLKGLDFMNSESIGFLSGVYAHLKKKGKLMKVVNMSQQVHDVLDTIGLLNFFAT